MGVIWGQNSNIFKPRQITYQNEALGPVIKKKMVYEVIRGHHPDPKIWGLRGHLRSKFKDFQTLTPSFGVKIKENSGPKIASSEARDYQGKTGRPIAPFHNLPRAKREAKEKRPIHQLPRAKRGAEKKRPFHQLPRAKREAKEKIPIHQLP